MGGDLKFPCGQGVDTPDINWTKTSAPVDIPSAITTVGWELDGAAGTGSKLAGQTDIRSGGPGQTTMAVLAQPLASLGHTITAATVSFEYHLHSIFFVALFPVISERAGVELRIVIISAPIR